MVQRSSAGDQDRSLEPASSKFNSRAQNNGGMKSARSFTQHKDFQMEKDMKNLTTNFTHGPEAMQGISSETRRLDHGHKLQNAASQLINNLNTE